MKETSLSILKKIEENGFRAYIVGGFVRDYLLGIKSNDIDITTNATPKELKEIFASSALPAEDYGSITVMYKNIRFEITTFRKETKYLDNRHPDEIVYIDDLYKDLERRDFTINAICMDSSGEIIDFLNGQADLNRKVINTIGNPKERFEEDCLRILRAVRFATSLDFTLSEEVEEAIRNKKHLLKNLSYYRKKEELDKIFVSHNAKKGIELLLKLGLEKELELNNLEAITYTDSLIGIWSMIETKGKYPFTKNEQELRTNIREALKLDNLDNMVLYKYGLYVNSVAGLIKGIDKKKVTEKYDMLPIKSKKDLDITTDDIIKIFNKKPGSFLNDIYNDIEIKVIKGILANNKEELVNYIQEAKNRRKIWD